MENTEAQIGLGETVLVSLDEGVIGALYRMAIGFAFLPALSRFGGKQRSEWIIVPGLLAVLFLMRVVPFVIRKVAPCSAPVQEIWANRRQLAKRFDSYQWRKLFWIGAGMALYMAASGEIRLSHMALSAACLFAGAIGLARWHALAQREPSAAPIGVKQTGAVG